MSHPTENNETLKQRVYRLLYSWVIQINDDDDLELEQIYRFYIVSLSLHRELTSNDILGSHLPLEFKRELFPELFNNGAASVLDSSSLPSHAASAA